MKIRTGFVSNSSSSSFLIGFYKKPNTVTELYNELYLTSDEYITCSFCDNDEYPPVSTKVATEKIFDQIATQHPLTDEEILNEMQSGFISGVVDYFDLRDNLEKTNIQTIEPNEYQKLPPPLKFRYDFFKKTGIDLEKIKDETTDAKQLSAYKNYRNLILEYYHHIQMEALEQILKNYKENGFKNKQIFKVEFTDNSGDPVEAILEHGNTFDNIPHIRISKH